MTRHLFTIVILSVWTLAALAGAPTSPAVGMAGCPLPNLLVPGGSGFTLDETDEAIFYDNFEYGATNWATLDLTAQATWHQDDFNAYGATGHSWWAGDSLLCGYDDLWLQYLESPIINLAGTVNPVLEFEAFWAVEGLSGGYPSGYNGWDGCNVWVSTNGGTTWEVLPVQSPAYTSTSLASFGVVWGMGPNVAGWTGFSGDAAPGAWVHVTANMAAYISDQVKIRFALAADEQVCSRTNSQLTGFFVDELNLHDGMTQYLWNNGSGWFGPAELTAVSGMGSVGNYWSLETVTTPAPPSPTHAFHLGNTLTSYPPLLNNALVTPRIALPDSVPLRIEADFWVCGSLNVGDPGSMPDLDYWTVQVSPDNGVNWYDYADPYNTSGTMSLWIDAPPAYTSFSILNGGHAIDLSTYAGQEVRLRILFVSDEDVHNGLGLFIDDFSVTIEGLPQHDMTLQDLHIPMPTSTYFSSLNGTVKVQNQGSVMESSVPVYWSQAGNPNAIQPFPTLNPWQIVTQDFAWTNLQEGEFMVKAYVALSTDTTRSNDTSYAGVVEITPDDVLEFGYDNRQYSYLQTILYYPFAQGYGPCVRFTPQADGVSDYLNALQLKAMFHAPGAVRVHVLEAGSASVPGPEAGAFDAMVDAVYPAWETFDLSGINYLQGARTDFWVWIEVTGADPGIMGAPMEHGQGHFFAHSTISHAPANIDFFIRTVMEPTVGVENPNPGALPAVYALGQNRPNPFNPSTVIPFTLPQAAPVKLTVFDLSGRAVATLVDGWRTAGSHQVTFDGAGLASGLYLYRLQAGDFTAAGKMVLMK
ncbi:MAG: T9SS C-terminal target domain-containing protein [Candidatus Zixiibacteriota bacterium]|nr:MAG: T9SS C-terminal target domain-containing protein [candidate division Zixibacteria bacterium]